MMDFGHPMICSYLEALLVLIPSLCLLFWMKLCSPLIKSLGWMSTAGLTCFESKQLVFKSLNNQAPQYI